MKSTGIKLLWNTSSLFTNPRFVSGASTSPFADIYAYAGGQLKHSLEIAKRLGAENYVFWGGREGYENHADEARTGAHGQVLPHVP